MPVGHRSHARQPPRWADGDAKFALAQRQRCTRRELIDGWIDAKVHIEDWTGLLHLASNTVSTRKGEDFVLRAYIRAAEELIRIARARGDRARRIELAEKLIETISRRTDGYTLAHSDREFFWNTKLNSARVLLEDTRAACRRPGDHVTVFDALFWLAERNLFLTEFVRVGIASLRVWWADVERRPYVDEGAKTIMKRSLARLEQLERLLHREGKQELSLEVQHVRLELAHRAAKLGWSA